MLTEKDYCDYDTCVALEELGFPIRRIKVKGEEKNIPILLYEAQMWLREEKKIAVLVYLDDLKGYYYYIRVFGGTWEMAIKYDQLGSKGVSYNVLYEEALLEGIKEAVKLLKEERK